MNCDFSVAGGGVHEVKRHCGSSKHIQGLKAVSKQPMLAAAFSAASPAPRDQVTTAELYSASIIMEHNLSFATADKFSKLCKRMFPDSKIAEQYERRRLLSSRMPWLPQLIRR